MKSPEPEVLMRSALFLLCLLSVGCGPAVALESYAGSYGGTTVLAAAAPFERNGPSSLTVFWPLTGEKDRLRFADFEVSKPTCTFNGKMVDGELQAIPGQCNWHIQPGTGDSCGKSLYVSTGAANLVGDELTIQINGEVRTGYDGSSCPSSALGRFTMVFNGHRKAQ